MRRLALVTALLGACASPSDGDPTDDTDATDTDADGVPDTEDDTDVTVVDGVPVVDPTCADGAAQDRRLPSATTDVSAVYSGFRAAAPLDFVYDLLDARYPDGTVLVEGGLKYTRLGDCFERFTTAQSRKTADGLTDDLSTVVHECGHFHDLRLGQASPKAFYQLDADLLLSCAGGGYDVLPARSRINEDPYSELRPPCDGSFSRSCDSYADLYLDGNPNDAKFDSGDQGLDMLVEELVQYVHTLGVYRGIADQLPRGAQVSGRDGLLTFFWYTERYLRWLRLEAPAKYDQVVGSACWREILLSAWGRGWQYLDATKDDARLGIDDGKLEQLVLDPDLLQEIERLRDADGCGQ